MPQCRTVRQRLRDFLRWADAQPLRAVPWLGHDGLSHKSSPMTNAGPCCADACPTRPWICDQGGGALVLRYGQTTTRIVKLTRDHLITSEAGGLPASENSAELWQP